ncbi:Pre-mRNA-splicing factor 38B [Gryllus bimaculatus]|nr:Pre-mRNA-splicing factor 38B [Gryllus bimaculatus]
MDAYENEGVPWANNSPNVEEDSKKPQKVEKKNNILPLWGNERTMNLNPLILTNIQSSHYFKVNLYELKTYHEVIDEIYYKVTHLEPWEKGSRKTAGQTGMCGGVRGVGAGGIVSTAYCLLYKLFTLKLTRKQVNGLLTHPDSPYIRGLGFMYVRLGHMLEVQFTLLLIYEDSPSPQSDSVNQSQSTLKNFFDLCGESSKKVVVCYVLEQILRNCEYCQMWSGFEREINMKFEHFKIEHTNIFVGRYTQPPQDLWDWYEPYLDDAEELDVKAGGGQMMTIGDMLRAFLTKLEWFSTLFPRIPVPIQQKLEKMMMERFPPAAPSRQAKPSGAQPPPPSKEARHIPDEEVSFGEAERFSRLRRTDNDRRRSPERERRRPHSPERKRERGREKSRDRSHEKSRDRSREKEKRYSRDRSPISKHRDRERDRDHRHRSHDHKDGSGYRRRTPDDFAEELRREKERQRREKEKEREKSRHKSSRS